VVLPTEDDLLARAKRGDRQAFDHLADPYLEPLRWVCWAVLKDDDLAKDTAVAALERAWWKIHQCQGPFWPWLKSIGHNLSLDYIKRPEFRLTEPLSDDLDSQAATFEDVLVLQIDFNVALSLLPEQHQTVLRLRYYSGLSWNEVAEIMETTPGAARKLHERAIHSLAQLLRPDDPYSPPPRTRR
jgi:RNA polymerase sigma-70 factor (ECF subfamily)